MGITTIATNAIKAISAISLVGIAAELFTNVKNGEIIAEEEADGSKRVRVAVGGSFDNTADDVSEEENYA